MNHFEQRVYSRWSSIILSSTPLETSPVGTLVSASTECNPYSRLASIVCHPGKLYLVHGVVRSVHVNNQSKLEFMLEGYDGRSCLPVTHFKWPHSDKASRQFEVDCWKETFDTIGSTNIGEEEYQFFHIHPWDPINIEENFAPKPEMSKLPPLNIILDPTKARLDPFIHMVHNRIMDRLHHVEQCVLQEFAQTIFDPRLNEESAYPLCAFYDSFIDFIGKPDRARLQSETKSLDSISAGDHVECIGYISSDHQDQTQQHEQHFWHQSSRSSHHPAANHPQSELSFNFYAGNVRIVHQFYRSTNDSLWHELRRYLRFELARERSLDPSWTLNCLTDSGNNTGTTDESDSP